MAFSAQHTDILEKVLYQMINGYIVDYLESAHKASWLNKEAIESSEKCGCFYCCQIYDAKEISEYVYNELSALCSKCRIDSVIPSNSGFPMNEVFLKYMRAYWFGR